MSEQQIKVSEEEIAKLKSAFADNEVLLKAMRALFFNLGVTKAEKEMIKTTFADVELLKIVSKRFNPRLSKESSIGQVQDVWLGAEQMVFNMAESTIKQAIGYKDRAIKMVDHALGLLVDPDKEGPRVNYEPSEVVNDPLGIELLARNQYIRHIENQLMFLMLVAGKKEETPQQTKKRLSMDSTK